MTRSTSRGNPNHPPIVQQTPPDIPPLPMSLGSSLSNKTGTWRFIRPVYVTRTPPCNVACPAEANIVHHLGLLRAGQWQAAWLAWITENPLPGVCGRVCPHPCEQHCNRAAWGGPLAIHALERALDDEAAAHNWRVKATSSANAARIAIVGSGPAGLACAQQLALLGYRPTVFEAENHVGGLLRHGIPSYRLPRSVLDREVEAIAALGVSFELGKRLGDNLDLDDLSGAAAVFLAVGQAAGRRLQVPGEESTGVWSALAYLRRLAAGERIELGARVIVVGGGNSAMDAARSALRGGAHVTVLYRRTAEEMPAIADEVAEARAEGVEFMFLAAPVSILSAANRVTGVRYQSMRLGAPGPDGRPRPEPVPSAEATVQADAVIIAVGQELDAGPLRAQGLAVADGRLLPGSRTASRRRGLYVGGDAAGGEGTVADAIGSGKRAARAIDHYVRTGRFTPAAVLRFHRHFETAVQPSDLNPDYWQTEPRRGLPQRPADVRSQDWEEVNGRLGRSAATREAGRCLSCGNCTECDTCLVFCPDIAIKRARPGPYRVDYDYCKGCGICARECPRSAVVMREEEQ